MVFFTISSLVKNRMNAEWFWKEEDKIWGERKKALKIPIHLVNGMHVGNYKIVDIFCEVAIIIVYRYQNAPYILQSGDVAVKEIRICSE